MLAADLFAGGGGLSSGLSDAGFHVVGAIESNLIAAETYRANHRGTNLLAKDIREVQPEELAKPRQLELLAACPPCQGFTSLTAKYQRDDPRNDLVGQVVRFAKVLKPRAVMLENVPRLATSSGGRRKLDPVLQAFEEMGYKVSWHILNAADFGVGQDRRRLVVYAAPDYVDRPESDSVPRKTVKDVIGRFTKATTIYSAKEQRPNQRLCDWHVTRRPSQLTLERLKYAKEGGSRLDLPERLRPQCHKGRHTGFINTYSRMSWGEPSPTITAGCLTLSKGRFGHPKELRTITLREAGRLQGFADSFVLPSTSIEQNLRIIGNAFPAQLATVAAKALR